MNIKIIFKRFFASLPFICVCIGICCIIVLFSITSTTKKEILNKIEEMGANRLILLPVFFDKSYQEVKGEIIYEDLQYVKRRCKEVKWIGWESEELSGLWDEALNTGKYPVSIEGRNFDKWGYFQAPIFLKGINPDYQKVHYLKLRQGRFINELDMKMKRNVCVLGYDIYSFLGGKKIINKKIKLLGYPAPVTVIGVLARYKPFRLPTIITMVLEGVSSNNMNLGIFIPYTLFKEHLTASKDMIGKRILIITDIDKFHKSLQQGKDVKRSEEKWGTEIEDKNPQMSEKIEKEYRNLLGDRFAEVNEVKEKILNVLRERYGQDKKFNILPEKRLLEEYEEQSRSANIFIASIGIVSLISSIIGILSMMLISVSTRTSEIGIRRAVGARKRDIFWQFLLETLIITGKGGLVGVVMGLCGAYLLGKYTGWEMVIPWCSLVLSIGTICIIAIISGIYPALKAAKIPPAQAVKYE